MILVSLEQVILMLKTHLAAVKVSFTLKLTYTFINVLPSLLVLNILVINIRVLNILI